MLTSLLAVVVCLDGLWDFRFARDRTLEGCDPSAFVATDKMIVPGCWDVQTRYFNQRGTGLYRRRFTLAEACAEAFLVVDGVGIRSRYWLDGREIGSSVSPWARLEFRTGPLAAGEHELVAAVDSVVDNAKVKLFWDFYDFAAFGGFYHGVRLETAKAPDEIRRVVVRTRDWRTGLVELEAFHVSDGPSDFTARVSFDGALRHPPGRHGPEAHHAERAARLPPGREPPRGARRVRRGDEPAAHVRGLGEHPGARRQLRPGRARPARTGAVHGGLPGRVHARDAGGGLREPGDRRNRDLAVFGCEDLHAAAHRACAFVWRQHGRTLRPLPPPQDGR